MDDQVFFHFFIFIRAGNPQEVLKSIADRHKMEPTGEPSLQNAIEMARGSMKYVLDMFPLLKLKIHTKATCPPILPGKSSSSSGP